jgi:NAD(P) transhydrogenase subunit alpha
VRITGNSLLAVDMPSDASKMFGKNVLNFLKLMFGPEGEFRLNWEDDLVKGTCLTHGKEIINEKVKSIVNA